MGVCVISNIQLNNFFFGESQLAWMYTGFFLVCFFYTSCALVHSLRKSRAFFGNCSRTISDEASTQTNIFITVSKVKFREIKNEAKLSNLYI